MKIKIVFYLVFSISLISTMNCQAQDPYKNERKISIYVGTNIVDDSFTSEKAFINLSDRMIALPYPSFYGVGVRINDKFYIDGTFSFNKYEKGKIVNGVPIETNQTYFAFDTYLKYDLSDFNYNAGILPFVKPFVFVGTGLTSIESKSRITINYGFGTYIWLKDFSNSSKINILNNIGFIIQVQGKSSLNQKVYGNQIQLMAGLAYRF